MRAGPLSSPRVIDLLNARIAAIVATPEYRAASEFGIDMEVLEFLHDGLSTAEIADRLSISPVTVRRHVSEILKKLRVTSREEAVKLMEEGESSSE